MGERLGETDFYLEEVFWGTVDLFEALLPCVWHGLHLGTLKVKNAAAIFRGVNDLLSVSIE